MKMYIYIKFVIFLERWGQGGQYLCMAEGKFDTERKADIANNGLNWLSGRFSVNSCKNYCIVELP